MDTKLGNGALIGTTREESANVVREAIDGQAGRRTVERTGEGDKVGAARVLGALVGAERQRRLDGAARLLG